MNKSIAKIFTICVIVIVVLLILVGLRLINEDGSVPSYLFLDGRNPVAYSEHRIDEIQYKYKLYTYSFETDFNDVCSKADAELIPTGFVVRTRVLENLSGDKFSSRGYLLRGKFPRGLISINIYNNRQYTELSNPQKDPLYMKDGWIMIEIYYGRGWRWSFWFSKIWNRR